MSAKNKSKNTKKDNTLTTITDEKTINEVLCNIGKKSKNPVKKELINNFVNNKTDNGTKKVVNGTYQPKTNQHGGNGANGDNGANVANNEDEKKTFTGNLTKDEINEKLQDYKLVDDISKVPIGTHLRYFVIKDGVKLFRMGGNLKRNLDLPKFIILVNALGTEWTVQIKDTTFYKKMSIKEIKEEYDEIIDELHEKIKKYKTKIEEKDNTIIELQDTIKKLKSKSK
jgi:hypothetical protein